MAPTPANAGEWTTGLLDCCQDCKTCCLTCFCPCVAFGQIAETIDKGNTSCLLSGAVYYVFAAFTPVLFHWIYPCSYRSKLRAAYGLPEKPCSDCCVHFFCEPCALCQMYRELKNRGLDPSHGWKVNSQKMTSAPVPMQDMRR